MDALLSQIASYLPPDLQAIVLNPPSLSRPSSFIPALRIIVPYTKYVVVLLAFYIVWSTISSVVGYFSRFMRFAMRIGPVLGFIAWVMAASGQGGMDELFQSVKEWTGLANAGNNIGGRSPGIANLANLFGMNTAPKQSSRKRRTTGLGNLFSSDTDPVSSRTRTKGKKAVDQDSDFVSQLLRSAVGVGAEGNGGNVQDVVQSYVKDALAKAAGLSWLFGQHNEGEETEARSGSRSR
ncbi:hypothetical protein BCR39DRAFT_559876 [Naematelia encephala]|uniref:Uncharacterized protein n=1 Tax=Naematelia encephala TaxID=71784 RepID=A0A1Y2AZX5_9TREE|nr:hypothetical protein BCR39DRAFT_559876 [Naematelia encephala]